MFRYVHTNIIAKDAQQLIAFYKSALHCQSIGETRDLSGAWLDGLTGLMGAHITGEHLLLPGYGEDHPTLEIFQYDELSEETTRGINCPGLTHLAFEVDDVEATLTEFVRAGGSAVGATVSNTLLDGRQGVFVYARDPEGNIVELQSWRQTISSDVCKFGNAVLETDRLFLRETTEADLPALCAILQDAETMYAYEGAFSDAEVRDWLARQFARYQKDGHGIWAVVLKATGEMIGQAGVTWQPVEDKMVPEIGYLLNRAHWHKGYAIEAAAACKRYAFDVLKLKEIYSIIRDTNVPSVNVAIRNGMLLRGRFVKHCRGVDMPHLLFSARADGS